MLRQLLLNMLSFVASQPVRTNSRGASVADASAAPPASPYALPMRTAAMTSHPPRQQFSALFRLSSDRMEGMAQSRAAPMPDDAVLARFGDLLARTGDLPPDQRPAALRRMLDNGATRTNASEQASSAPPAFEVDWSRLEREAASEFAGEPNVESFATLLGRLGETKDARTEDGRRVLKARVDDILSELRQSKPLRRKCFELAEEALGRCRDRVALGLDWIEEAIVNHRAKSGRMSEGELFDLGRRMFRQALLDRRAWRKIGASPYLDDVEVLLAYHVEFADRLELPRGAADMASAGCAHLSDQEIEDAVREVREAEGGLAMQQYLCDYKPWQKQLRRTHRGLFARRLEAVQAKLDRLAVKPEGMNDFDYAGLAVEAYAEKKPIETALIRELTQAAFDPPASA